MKRFDVRKVAIHVLHKRGRLKQLGKVMEEAGELIAAIARLRDGDHKDSIATLNAERCVMEEAADMEIVGEQLRVMFGDDVIDVVKQEKLRKAVGLLELVESKVLVTDVSCSFCGKEKAHVSCLIAGPLVYICNECVKLCAELCGESLFQEVRGIDEKVRPEKDG